MPEGHFRELIGKAQALDMAEIRRQIAAEQGGKAAANDPGGAA